MSKENSFILVLPDFREVPVSRMEKEVDEGVSKKSLGEKILKSRVVKKVLSYGGAAMLAMSPAAAEVDLKPKDGVIFEGEMPSQNLLTNGTVEVSTKSEREKQIDQRFSDFLNGVGEYDEVKVNMKSLSTSDGQFRDLGVFSVSSSGACLVQSVLLHCETTRLNQYLALGIKNKKGEREIVVVEWVTGLTTKLEHGFGVGTVQGSVSGSKRYSTVEEAIDIVEASVGNCVIAYFQLKKLSSREGYDSINYSNYFNYLHTKIPINENFVAGLLWPEKKQIRSQAEKGLFNKVKNVKSKISGVNNLSEMKEKIINGVDNMPVIYGFDYKVNQ